MADVVGKSTRSRMMAGIGPNDTAPELALRKALHALGFRFRLHCKNLPGKPDLVLPKYKAAVFAHGCYWHRHCGCRYATTPSTRPEFWATKFAQNVARDTRVLEELVAMGWRVAVVWECALRKPVQVSGAAAELERWLRSEASKVEISGKYL